MGCTFFITHCCVDSFIYLNNVFMKARKKEATVWLLWFDLLTWCNLTYGAEVLQARPFTNHCQVTAAETLEIYSLACHSGFSRLGTLELGDTFLDFLNLFYYYYFINQWIRWLYFSESASEILLLSQQIFCCDRLPTQDCGRMHLYCYHTPSPTCFPPCFPQFHKL